MRILIVLCFIVCFWESQAQTVYVSTDSQKVFMPSPGSISVRLDYQKAFSKHFEFDVLENTFQKPALYALLEKKNHIPGLFCKMEYNIELKSKLSPRFRLGSLKYTEWMEGKGEFYDRY